MEYRGYTPDEVKKDKRKNLFFIILLIFPLLFGLVLLVGGFGEIASIKVEDVKNISYKEMVEGEEYYFDEMVLVDTYAYVGDSTTGYAEMRDYIVSFVDNSGERVYTSIRTEGWSEFNEKCEAYIEDDSLTVGDVILSGCFHGYENGETIHDYFEEAYEIYNAELPGELLDWTLYYDDVETIEEYREEEMSNQIIIFVMAAMITIPCVVGILLLVRKRKELDRYIAEYHNEPYNHL